MQIVRDLTTFRSTSPSAVTIGVFDGVHRGHQQLIGRMVSEAHAAARTAVAYTFASHPAAAMDRRPPQLLTTLGERAALLKELGLDLLAVPPFTRATARTGAAEFASVLVNQLGMVELWAGPDFALGHQREGDIRFLNRLGSELGFSVRVVDPITCEGDWVSSSRIRAALIEGELHWANQCLGRPYRLTGVTKANSALASTSGLPIVSVALAPERVVPAAGVYACLAHVIRIDTLVAVTYLSAPGRDTPGRPRAEVHLVGAEPTHGRSRLTLDFLSRLRDVAEAPSQARLRTALVEDAHQAQALVDAQS